MSRVVILGHAGFIGSALQTHLQHEWGCEVLGFSSSTADLRRPEGTQALEDCIDRETLVILASAITRDKGDTLATLMDNIAMAGHLGAFLESHPPAKCIYFSSDAVYPMQDRAITEETPVAPGGTFYAIAKYAGECVLRKSMEAQGVPLLVLRPTAVFGPGDTHNSYGPNAFIRSVIRERAVRLFGQGEETRDHLYVEDLVRLVTRLVDAGAVGVVNIATGTSYSFAEVVETLRRVAPVEFAVTYLPRKGVVTHRQFDIARLRQHMDGFRFTTLEEAMRATYTRLHATAETA